MGFRANYGRLSAIVIIFAAILRFALASVSHASGDSCWHLAAARFIAQNMQIPLLQPFGSGREVFWAPPLFHIVAAGFYKLFYQFGAIWGPTLSDFSMKMVSPLFGSMTLIFVYLIAKKLFDRKIAFYSVLFMAFVPLHIYQSSISYVDSFTAFFVVASVYFLLQKRLIVSAVFFGLSLIAKQTALFTLPLMFYIVYRQYKGKVALKSAVFAGVTALVGCWWFIRNQVLLGNAFWPFFYKFFGGKIAPYASETGFNIFNILHPLVYLQGYLEFFGVPLGSYAIISGFSIPFKPILLSGWLIATMLFIAPLFIGIAVLKLKSPAKILYLWILLNVAGVLIYVMSLDTFYSRFMLPAFPAFAMLWAVGFDRLLTSRIKKVAILLFVAVAFVFVSAEFGKDVIAARQWQSYSDDFSWIRANLEPDAFFYYGGQCLSYNINRLSDFSLDKPEAYIWINPNFALEPVAQINTTILKEFSNYTLSYNNPTTGTEVYLVKQ
ncbi:MAG: glycosyltransferase family 39 protein [Candidatus Woesearchaeota archaeon]